MWKTILAGTTALAIAGTSLVYAQQRDQGPARWRNHDFSQEDRAAFTDARIAALKAGLRLTPDQEKNWPAFETALRDIAKLHQERRADRRGDGPRAGGRGDNTDLGSVERLRRHAEAMTKTGESLKRLADAQEPLYQSLDDSQKNRFKLLASVLTSHRPHFAQMRGHGDHRGFRGDRHHDRDDNRRGPRGPRGDDRGPQRGMMGGTGEQL